MPFQPAFLPEVERRERSGDGEPGKSGKHESHVKDQKEVGVVTVAADPGSTADACKDEEHDGERKDCEAEQAVTRLAAPDQIRAYDEPDEEIQRAGPRGPGKAVGARNLRSEQRRLHQPADTHAPGGQPSGEARVASFTKVRNRGFAVREQGGPEEQLSQLRPLSVRPRRDSSRARARPARPARAPGA